MTHQTLGCSNDYAAVIHHRGGVLPLVQLRGITALVWSRRLDETSDASVTVDKSAAGIDCCAQLAEIQPWGHELTIYRDGELVWQGPVNTVTETRTSVQIDALDVTAWLDVRVNRVGYDFTAANHVDWVDMALYFINQAFGPDNPNVLEYVRALNKAGAPGERKAGPYTVTWGDELREIANIGMDYTTVGRAILLAGDLLAQSAIVAPLHDGDFGTELEVVLAGNLLATRQVVTGNDGAVPAFAGPSPPALAFYGLVELLTVVDDATSTSTTQAVANTQYAQQYPQPVVVRVPDGASLLPTAHVTIARLIAGTRIDLTLSAFCRQVRQTMRLVRMTATWTTSGSEQIQVAMQPLGTLEVDALAR